MGCAACRDFHRINTDERLLRITTSHVFPIVGEDIELRIVANSTDEASVEIKSSDKLLYNIFKWGNNKRNVKDITALIQNEIYRYLKVDDSACYGRRSKIGIVPSEIKLSK